MVSNILFQPTFGDGLLLDLSIFFKVGKNHQQVESKICLFNHSLDIALSEIDKAPENQWLEDEFLFGANRLFSEAKLFQGVYYVYPYSPKC